MIPGSPQHMQQIASAMEESQVLWNTVCDQVEDKRVEMLIQALTEQYALVMEGETNANAIMSLIGFIADQAIFIAEDGEVSTEVAMVLLQMGMQKGVAAHLAMKDKAGAS